MTFTEEEKGNGDGTAEEKLKKKLTFLRTPEEHANQKKLIQEAKDNPSKPPVDDELDRGLLSLES